MKKLIILSLIVILAGSIWAKDIIITITIPENKVADFSAAFEAYMPAPMIDDPNFISDPNSPDVRPPQVKMPQKRWLRNKVLSFLKKIEFNGKKKLKTLEVVTDPNTFEVTVE